MENLFSSSSSLFMKAQLKLFNNSKEILSFMLYEKLFLSHIRESFQLRSDYTEGGIVLMSDSRNIT